jgi:hypothetical protein
MKAARELPGKKVYRSSIRSSPASSSPKRKPGRPPSGLTPKKKEPMQGSAVAMSREKVNKQGHNVRKRKRFTFEEEEVILEGYKQHGTQWNMIRLDPQYAEILQHRTNVDIKDKYKNLMKQGRA